MKRILSLCVVVITVGFCTIAMVRTIRAAADSTVLNAMGACQGASNPPLTGKKCKKAVDVFGNDIHCSAHGPGICSRSMAGTPTNPADCTQCTGGTCLSGKVTEEKAYGKCEAVAASAGYAADTCTQCDYLVCAKGEGFGSDQDCMDNRDPCTNLFAWQSNACKP